jgi:hypothetical protein
MALEYSELMAGAAMFFSNAELTKAVTTEKELQKFLKQCQVKAKKDIEIPTERTRWLDAMKSGDPKKTYKSIDDQLSDLVRGISAAKAIKKWLQTVWREKADAKATKVFLTGNVWPKEVNPFQVKAYGFDSYNSSDLIIRLGKGKYYGVSLKKKSKKNENSPTLINKAFDTILVGNEFDPVKKKLQKVREKFFAGLVKQAHKKRIINVPKINSLPDAELFLAKNRDKKTFKRSYIDTKGGIVNNYKDDWPKDRKTGMRAFVNSELAKSNNNLWKGFNKVLNEYSNLFAESLINVTLKTKLNEEIENKELVKMRFGFALVTGVGFIKNGKISLGQGNAYDIHTILCGLSNLGGNRQKYNIVLDKKKTDASGGAKVFFNLSKKQINILELELRYKGGFTSQPQFLGVMSDAYQEIMVEKCLIKRS